MRLDQVWINGTGAELGARHATADAVAAGRYSAEAAESTGMTSYSVCHEAAPELAVSAAREAAKHAATHGVELDAARTQVVHSHAGFQGIENWSAACWIAGELLGETLATVPLGLQAWSNGGVAGMGLAASVLATQPDVDSVLLTMADRFAPSADRFYASPGMVFGDGGAAAVLSSRPGPLRLVSLTAETDTVLGGLARGAATFVDEPTGDQVSGRDRTREFLATGRVSLRSVQQRSAERMTSVVGRALADAGLGVDDVDLLVAPFIGRTLFRESFVRPLGLRPRWSSLEHGLTVGHLSSADQVVGLHHVLSTGIARAGDHVLVIGTGMGFTYTAAVVRVDQPL